MSVLSKPTSPAVLIFSEMFPKPNSAHSGIFIIKRLEQLQKNKINFNFVPLSVEDGFLISLAKKIRGSNSIALMKELQVNDAKFDVEKIPISNKQRLGLIKGNEKDWLTYAEKMADFLSKTAMDYSLLHAHRAFPEGYAAMLIKKRYGIPYIVTSHGGEIHSSLTDLKKYIPLILNESCKSIFVSKALMEEAIKIGFSGETGIVIPNGVDTSLFRPLNKSEIKKELGIDKNTKCVGFVGNLVPVKRADKLSDIFHKISSIFPKTNFVVVGDGYLRKQIESETKDLKILFTGRLHPEEVPYYMNSMDVMILPSRNEGFGAVVIEANSCGVPVVGANVGGIPEAIGNNKMVIDQGFDFEQRFSERVCKVLSSSISQEKLSAKASKYDWKNIAKKEIELYETLIK